MRQPSTETMASGRGEITLVANLLEEALKLLESDRAGARRRIDEAQALVRSDHDDDRGKNGLLAGWQLRRAEAFIRDHIDTRLRVGLVARVLNLSPSYFSHAFKATKGITYSDYVMNARVALAKRLLLTTKLPISQIALNCGMADQSHLCRSFNRVVGTSPRAWRCRQIADQIPWARSRSGGKTAEGLPVRQYGGM
jgi:AraC family transcriptional regulator